MLSYTGCTTAGTVTCPCTRARAGAIPCSRPRAGASRWWPRRSLGPPTTWMPSTTGWWATFHWPVQQAYAYYQPSMRWAEPDLAHASSRHATRLRTPGAGVRERGSQAADALRTTYSVGAVGARGRARSDGPPQSVRTRRSGRRSIGGSAWPRQSRSCPFPGEWYDADYFEHGLKSNWRDGYRWAQFKGVFEDTAAYLEEMFPRHGPFWISVVRKAFWSVPFASGARRPSGL